MKGVSVLVLFLGLCMNRAQAQFYNNRPFPTYSLENMPDTGFSCRDKILGGYYADAETQCQMFHICVKVAGVGIQDFRFLCPNGTAFDQDHQICAEWEDIDCDATTLYYSSDNFDLYRLGSGFESKALKYGEDEETFSLQRAETGDARINREQQSNVVNQKKEPRYYSSRLNNQHSYNNNNNNNNEKEIFKGSSSSNFFNNRNNGKERDDDYDDNVNVNQDRDVEQRRKVARNKIRRPVNNQNRNQNNRNAQNINNYNINNQNTGASDNNEPEAQTRRPSPSRSTGFINNFAGSSYIPTTSRSTSTTLNADQYSTAINNYRSRNGQRQRQYTDIDSPIYTISTPAPFRQTQQYNPVPNRHNNNNNNGQYYSTTQAPQKETENYPQQKSKQTTASDNYDITKVKQTGTTSAQTYNTQYDTSKVKQAGSTSAQNYNVQYDSQKVKQVGTTTAQSYNSQYDTPKVKQAGSTSAQNYNAQYDSQKVKQVATTSAQSYNTQYDTPKVKQAGTTSAQSYNTQYDTPKVKQTGSTAAETYNTQFDSAKTKFTGTTAQYETTKQKQTKGTSLQNTENYPSNNPRYNAFDKKSTTPLKHAETYQTTLSPKPFSLNSFPTTFAPRTNAAYTRIAQQTVNYSRKQNTPDTQSQQNTKSTTFSQQSRGSTPKSTIYTQYTPTVPKLSSTTPVSRSNRFDETEYDDGSYNSKYDYDGDRREDEFLKTAHSQNIAASRNEFTKNSKQQPSTQTQRTTYESPRPFSVTAKVTVPKTSPKPTESKKAIEKPKKTKDVSYDYAYYDSNVGSEPDYDIDTEIKKSTVEN